MLQRIEGCNVTFLEVSGAYDETINQIKKAKEKLKDLFPKFLPEQADDIQVVLLGRPYTVLSPSMNNGIPDIFGSLGIRTYYQDMVPITPEDTENIGPLLAEIHWNYAAKILETAEAVAGMEGVYPVLITSFKCSPDSYITTYLKKLLDSHDKPYLILELDEHDSAIGYETRIEAAVRAFRNHAEAGQQGNADLNGLMPGYASKLKGKTLLMPNWDNISLPLVAANLQKEGYDVKLLDETDEIIRRSLRHNTGQCIPMNAIAEGYIDYIEQHGLEPGKTVLWLPKSECACNIPLYPYHIQTILKDYGNSMEKAGVYTGDLSFADFSPTVSLNAYFAFMFGGYIRRMGCRLRPYEIEKGKTDQVITESVKILLEAFKGNRKKDEAAIEVIDLFESIEINREERLKVAIFGDLYVRDNEVMNQDLIRFIEEQGGEVITTPYSEYAKIIANTSFRRMFKARKYKEIIIFKSLLAVMKTLEKSYYQQFSRILRDTDFSYDEPGEEILKTFGLKVEHSGESAENILKIYYLKKHFPDISLFVQTNPAFCCPGIVTEAMRKQIEEITGVPVVSVTYDGTGGNKNEAIIPYLKFPRKSRTPGGEKEKRETG
jgi:predicted nucleotide-binding protein (sugar kinase/HSP70/actin superfamily)